MLRRALLLSALPVMLAATAAVAAGTNTVGTNTADTVGTGARTAGPSRPAPYHRPPFAASCHVRHFGEGVAPPATGYKDDPLCVDYAKRDITVDNGGAVRFVLAEPARFAIAAKPCKYWQTDHWSVQVDRGFTAFVRWDGSYWFDKGRGTGAALLRNFRIAGQPVGARQAAALVATVSPPIAAQIRRYGAGAGGSGGGMSFSLGGGDPQCATH